eukprot:6202321-Pleurochrysis_carterae.AAC.1
MKSLPNLPAHCNATFSWEPPDALSRLDGLSPSLRMKLVDELLSPSCCIVRPAVTQLTSFTEYSAQSAYHENSSTPAKRASDARSSSLKFTYLIVMTTSHARMRNVAVAYWLWM